MRTDDSSEKCFVLRVAEAVAPKVSGGLAAIEEEIRENAPNLTVTIISTEPIWIDDVPVPCVRHQRWFLGDRFIAEVRTEIADQEVDCVVMLGGTQLFKGSIEDWWAKMSDVLSFQMRQAQN
jgi:hypothetical protein